MRPTLAFTPGDPGGVGPEVLVRALKDASVRRACRPLVVGPSRALRRAGWRSGLAPLLEIPETGSFPRRPTAAGGRASFAALNLALSLARRGLVDGMVTAPASKEGWKLAGIPFLDHTGFLAAELKAERVGMWLEGGGLRTVLVTRHIPHRSVPGALNFSVIEEAAVLGREGLSVLGPKRGRIALCALNPHAGDAGLIGSEEKRLAPMAKRLRIAGPMPADAAWAAHKAGDIDLLLTLYHDQALIPLKVHAGYGIVNWTLGIDVVRTAPGHGTAYDLAGTGKADPSGMIAAALLAAKAAKAR